MDLNGLQIIFLLMILQYLMIRRPSYKQFLNQPKDVQSSVNLSFNQPPTAHSLLSAHPYDPSQSSIQLKREPADRAWRDNFLNVIKYIPDDPRTLRHTCIKESYTSTNLNDSFNMSKQMVSPKRTVDRMTAKQARPTSSFRPSHKQQPKKQPSNLSAGLQSFKYAASKVEDEHLSDAKQVKTLYQSKSSAKLAKLLSDVQIEREIERLRELRNRRMQNNANIKHCFEDKFKTDTIQLNIPKPALNLSCNDNKENQTNQIFPEKSNKLDLSTHGREKSKTPVRPISAQCQLNTFTPIQFRKHPSNEPQIKNGAIQPPAKSPIKRDSTLTAPSNKSETKPMSSFHIEIAQKQAKKQKKVCLSDFAVGKKMGEGRFGSVFAVFHKATGAIFAMKKIAKSIIRQNFMIQQFILEVKIQFFIEHAYVVRLFGIFDDQDNIYLLLEYLEGGTLYNELKRKSKGRMPQEETSSKMRMICQAVNCLHQKGIAHRDIKPENIIITNQICKLADFGWATLCDQRRRTYCGTTDYVAPEIVEGLEYDISVDLWCLGVLAYELMAGRAPFYHISRQETFNKIKNADSSTLSYPEDFSSEAIDFIGRLIKKNPNERMEMDEAVQHSFITKYHL